MIAAFLCLVLSVHDGDTIRCTDNTRVRIAGIQAPDYANTEPCRRHAAEYICDNAAADRSRRIVDQLVRGKVLTCRRVDMSFKRLVAICSMPGGADLRCRIVAAGAAADWARYVRRYRLRGCS